MGDRVAPEQITWLYDMWGAAAYLGEAHEASLTLTAETAVIPNRQIAGRLIHPGKPPRVN